MYDISFPKIGIYLNNIPDGITIFGIEIKFYGIIIAIGVLLAYMIASKEAKRTGQNLFFGIERHVSAATRAFLKLGLRAFFRLVPRISSVVCHKILPSENYLRLLSSSKSLSRSSP